MAYMKINEKIEQLEKLVRVALEEVQEEKNQHGNFTPKVINYSGDNYQTDRMSNVASPIKGNDKDKEEFSEHANLSQ